MVEGVVEVVVVESVVEVVVVEGAVEVVLSVVGASVLGSSVLSVCSMSVVVSSVGSVNSVVKSAGGGRVTSSLGTVRIQHSTLRIREYIVSIWTAEMI